MRKRTPWEYTKKIFKYMFGGFFIKSQETAIISFVTLLGFVELFAYVGSPLYFISINSSLLIVFISLMLIRLAVALRVEQIMYTDLEAQAKEQADENKQTNQKKLKSLKLKNAHLPHLNLKCLQIRSSMIKM